MRQLTKEQLTNIVNDNCKKVIGLNRNEMVEHLLDSIKGSGDNCGDLMIKLVVAYGVEIINECNQVLIETLDHVLNAE